MFYSFLFYFCALLTFFSQGWGEILETQQFQDLKKHTDPQTLILLDIDNTIMEPTQQLGSDQWFQHRVQRYKKKGLDSSDALETALAEWMAIQNVTKMRLVEPSTAEVIHKLQNEGYTIMGFTTRGLGLSTRTIHQLKSLGVDLSRSAPIQEELHYMNGEGVLYRKGILFTAGSHKGTAFTKFLDLAELSPKSVAFINDKESNLLPVQKACQTRKIPFIGLRYGATDERVHNFNPEVTDIQMEAFGMILSDEEAEKCVPSHT